jgi:hypothetical protein
MATKVLFIGNSYTFYNNLPGMLEDLATSAGQDVETSRVVSGGKTLEWHWYNPATLDTLSDNKWDIVVFQEHSMRPVEEPDKMMSAVKRLKERAGEARVILYLTWARQHIPEMQDVLNDTYFRVAKELGCSIAPVGLAWQKSLREIPDLVLHTDDRSHPNTLGSYLAACVFYATIFNASPIGLTHTIRREESVSLVIDDGMAKHLQTVAWNIVKTENGFILK